MGALSVGAAVAISIAIAIAFALVIDGAGVNADTGLYAGMVSAGVTGAIAGIIGVGVTSASVGGAITGGLVGGIPGIFVGIVVGTGVGIAMRALLFRFLATLSHLRQGAIRLPENWRENNFLTDSFLPAEVMPGIRDSISALALDGFFKLWREQREILKRTLYPIVATFLFLPAFLYRLNIKATAWFWWPLALLLKPAPAVDEESAQKEALCAPWTDPGRMIWTLVSVLLGLLPLMLQFTDFKALHALGQADRAGAVPLGWEIMLVIHWAKLAPWNWLQLVMAGTGIGIFMLAGRALSHKRNGNWAVFSRSWALNNGLMTFLKRVHSMASIAVMVLALGAVTLQADEAQSVLPGPVVEALRAFYSRWTPPEKPKRTKAVMDKLVPEGIKRLIPTKADGGDESK